MKKYLIVLAATLVALVGCKKNGGSEYTRISLKQSEISIGVEQSFKLNLLWEPSSIAEAPACVWSSSDSNVATVDQNGNVTGVDLGSANITAKYGELTAVCKVNVKDAYDLIEWGGLAWWTAASKEPLTNDTIVIESSRTPGTFFHCVPALVYIRLWSDGLYMTELGGLAGDGADAFNLGMGLLITDSLDERGPNTYVLGANYVDFVDPEIWNPYDTAFLFTAPAGVQDATAEELYNYWITGTNENEPVYGSYFQYYNADSSKLEDGLIGLLKEGTWIGNDYGIERVDADVEWYDFLLETETPSFCGLLLGLFQDEEDGSYYLDIKEPYEWAPTIKKHYEFNNQAGVNKKYNIAPLRKETPEEILSRRVKDNKVLIKK